MNRNPFFKGWKPGGEDLNSAAAELLRQNSPSGSPLRGQAWSQETKGIFPLLRRELFLFFLTYLITKLLSKLKCLLQVNKHSLLAEQICTQELGMIHLSSPDAWIFLKMDLKKALLCYSSSYSIT